MKSEEEDATSILIKEIDKPVRFKDAWLRRLRDAYGKQNRQLNSLDQT